MENFDALDVIARTRGKVDMDHMPVKDRLFLLWGTLGAVFFGLEFVLWQFFRAEWCLWLWIGIPGVLIWLAAFAYLVLQQTDYEEQGQYILYGMAFGLLIGSALGYIMYRRQQRLIDDLRDSIETT